MFYCVGGAFGVCGGGFGFGVNHVFGVNGAGGVLVVFLVVLLVVMYLVFLVVVVMLLVLFLLLVIYQDSFLLGNAEVIQIHFDLYCLYFCASENGKSQSPQLIKILYAMAFNNLSALKKNSETYLILFGSQFFYELVLIFS